MTFEFPLLLFILLSFFIYLTYLPQHYFIELHRHSGSMEQQRQPQDRDDQPVTSEADNNKNLHQG